jgi:hypothetical protein
MQFVRLARNLAAPLLATGALGCVYSCNGNQTTDKANPGFKATSASAEPTSGSSQPAKLQRPVFDPCADPACHSKADLMKLFEKQGGPPRLSAAAGGGSGSGHGGPSSNVPLSASAAAGTAASAAVSQAGGGGTGSRDDDNCPPDREALGSHTWSLVRNPACTLHMPAPLIWLR